MQFEYFTVFRVRGWEGGQAPKRTAYYDIPDENVENMLNDFGKDGRELVSVTPRSDYMGNGAGGTTTSEMFIFKREQA